MGGHGEVWQNKKEGTRVGDVGKCEVGNGVVGRDKIATERTKCDRRRRGNDRVA